MLSQSFGYRHKSFEIRLYPSKIHFTNCVETTDNQNITEDPVMEAFCEKVLEKGEYPRLQVTEKDGHFFTLNNTRLHLFKRLQEMGYCSKVSVEKIPLCDIPCGIRDMMTVVMESNFRPKQKGNKKCHYSQVNQKESDRKSGCGISSDDNLEEENSDDLDSDFDTSDDEGEDDDDSCSGCSEEPSVFEEESLL